MRRAIVVLVALLAVAATPAFAAPIYAGFPAPGGTAFSSVGSAGATGGAMRTYSGFDTNMFDDLYFGFEQVLGPLLSAAPATSQLLTAGALGGSEIIWTGANWFIDRVSVADVSVPVRFRTSFFDMSNNNITSLAVSGASVGIAGQPYVLGMDAATLAAWGGGFKVLAAFEAFNGSAWVGVNDFFNALTNTPSCNGPCVQTATVGAFWYTTPTTAPEPATLALFGLASLGAAHRLRRRTNPID